MNLAVCLPGKSIFRPGATISCFHSFTVVEVSEVIHVVYVALLQISFLFKLPQVFFQDDTKDAVAGAAVAANAALVADAVRCMPLPASLMPEHAVPLGHERFSACGAEDGGNGEETKALEPDFTVLLTRPCLSFDRVRGVRAVFFRVVVIRLRRVLRVSGDSR